MLRVFDGRWMDHDAGRILVFIAIAVYFSVRALMREPERWRNLRWACGFYFLFLWTVYDHFLPLRVWFPNLYR